MRCILLLIALGLLGGCSLLSTAAPAAPPTPPAETSPAEVSLMLPSPAAGHMATAAPAPTRSPTMQPTSPPTVTPTPPPAATPVSPTFTPVLPTQSPTDAPAPPPAEVRYSFPMGIPGRSAGDGFFVRHGYAVENTWFNPGYWHTGEDWYLLEGDSGGAHVYAIAAGEVVYVGSNYPGRVVIVRHDDGLFSMYGHLDPAVAVQSGQRVSRGAFLGTLLHRSDNVPDHLHFEVRTFFTTREVNGAAPRYGFRCGVNCPPGPGYWPIDAPDHPSDMGWRNPTHVIAQRAFAPAAEASLGEVVVVSQPISSGLTLWSEPPAADSGPAASLAELSLQPGQRYPLLETWTGAEDTRATSAQGYRLWYRLRLPDGREGWVQAAVPTTFETGSDGRPATVRFNLVPARIIGSE